VIYPDPRNADRHPRATAYDGLHVAAPVRSSPDSPHAWIRAFRVLATGSAAPFTHASASICALIPWIGRP